MQTDPSAFAMKLTGRIATDADSALQEVRNLLSTGQNQPENKQALQRWGTRAIGNIILIQHSLRQLRALLEQIPDAPRSPNPTAATSAAARKPPAKIGIPIGQALEARLGPTDGDFVAASDQSNERTTTPD